VWIIKIVIALYLLSTSAILFIGSALVLLVGNPSYAGADQTRFAVTLLLLAVVALTAGIAGFHILRSTYGRSG